jgi:hypothetical protein
MTCTRCGGTGFLNTHQIPAECDNPTDLIAGIQAWMAANPDSDVQVCDCCGDGDEWYDEPGEHNSRDYGRHGPYAHNGGLPECY